MFRRRRTRDSALLVPSSGRTRRNPGRPRPGVILVASLLSALATALATTLQSTAAGFTDPTSNLANSWQTGQVTITNTYAGSAAFSTGSPHNDPLLTAGGSLTRCITVTYAGDFTGGGVSVKMYGTVTGSLAPYLTVAVERGTADPSGNCSTALTGGSSIFSNTLDNLPTSYGTGVGSWSPASTSETRVYRIIVTASSDSAAQNLTAAGTFVWEAQVA